jgi:glycosyltransferase involved in cell wall biosynthesis
LAKLLRELQHQTTEGLFTYSVVVVDNDDTLSAKTTVEDFKASTNIDIEYHSEPEQNIALARNKAVINAKGDFIAFIDDDEFPNNNWLLNLYKLLTIYKVDGVLGPVKPYFEKEPPPWIIKGKFFERPSHKTGHILHWTNTRTGNVLMKKDIFNENENMFKLEFGSGGEDRDFFRRMIGKGYRFIWCEEASVCETVPQERCKRSFMLKRALLRGKNPDFKIFDYAISIIAIPLYSLALPFFLMIGHHIFMKYLIKDFDHIGRVLSFCGINVVKQKYIIE